MEKTLKTSLLLLKLVIYLFIWVHFMACLWWWTTVQNVDKVDKFGTVTTWYPPLDWINFVDTRLFTEEYDFKKKFTTAFYYSVLTLANNELGPVNPNEMYIISVLLMLCLFVNAFVLSDVAVLIGEFGKEDSKYQEKLDSMNGLIMQLKLDDELAEDIREFFYETYNTRETQEELDNFFDMIPNSY